MACRIRQTGEWTLRVMHELHGTVGSFITLTYSKENLPEGGTLVKRDLQLFIKRLRKYIGKQKIKFIASGEYGESETKRPHYHIITIGWRHDPKATYKVAYGQRASKEIEKLWLYGNNTIGSADRDAVQYTVGYIRKKLNGEMAETEYSGKLAPFQLQSQGIGLNYAKEHIETVVSERGFTNKGKHVGLPRYYWKKLIKEGSPEEFYLKQAAEKSRSEKLDYYKELNDHELLDLIASDNERRRKQMSARKQMTKKGRL
ncbi:MAG: hypothetical protein LBU88_01710 [Treponema sp.]|nr:hypothetical protein [Treponema sp.]